jgi:hypothetical protein
MEEKNIGLLFEFLITEDNEQGQLICLTCNEDITKDKERHTCSSIKTEQQPEFIYF